MKSKNKLLLIALLIIINAVLLGCSGLNVNQQYIYDDTEYGIGNKAFGEILINEIDIDWIVGNIYIEESSNHEIIIRENIDIDIEEQYKMHYLLKDDVLDVKYTSSLQSLNYKFKNKDLYVYLPSEIKNININNVSSDISINNVNINSLTINSVSGYINIDSNVINQLKIDNTSGEIILMNNKVSTCEVNSVSGNIGMSYSLMPTTMNISTTSASLTLYLNLNDCLNVSYTSISGKLSSDVEYIEKDGYFIINSSNVQSDKNYKINTISGNLKIRKK